LQEERIVFTELFSADLFEYQEIFASPIATAVFVYATAALLLVSAGAALVYTRRPERGRAIRAFRRAS
jgi:hypothetical protein